MLALGQPPSSLVNPPPNQAELKAVPPRTLFIVGQGRVRHASPRWRGGAAVPEAPRFSAGLQTSTRGAEVREGMGGDCAAPSPPGTVAEPHRPGGASPFENMTL